MLEEVSGGRSVGRGRRCRCFIEKWREVFFFVFLDSVSTDNLRDGKGVRDGIIVGFFV